MSGNQNFDECACFNTRRAARLLGQAYDRALGPSGLNNTQFATLASIAGAGELAISELAAAMGVDRTTLTRNLTVMQRTGLVKIESGADARTRLVSLTGAGKTALEKAIPLWQQVQSLVVDGLEDWPALLGQIRKLARSAQTEG